MSGLKIKVNPVELSPEEFRFLAYAQAAQVQAEEYEKVVEGISIPAVQADLRGMKERASTLMKEARNIARMSIVKGQLRGDG